MAQLKTLYHIEDNFMHNDTETYVAGTMQGILVSRSCLDFRDTTSKLLVTHQAVGHCVGVLL